MPIPSAITDLSTTPSANSPTGSDTPTEGDNHIRTAYSFIRQLYDSVTAIQNSYTSLTALADTSTATLGPSLVGYNPALAYASGIGQFLNYTFGRTAGEVAAGVTPTNYAYFPGTPERYGAAGNGSTNDYAAWQAALDAMAGVVGGGFVTAKAGSTYKINSMLNINPNRVGIEGNGAILDFSSLSSGYALQFSQTDSDPNNRQALNRTHPIKDLKLVGTSSATGSVTCLKGIDVTPLSGPAYWLAGVTFQNCSFVNWWRDFESGNGCFLWSFNSCQFSITGGSGYDTSIIQQNATNSGENHNFNGCFFGKVIGSVVRNLYANSVLNFTSCSADYNANIFDVQAGEVNWDGYIEASNDTDYWAKVSGTNSLLRIAGYMAITGNKSSFELFQVATSATVGGLIYDLSMQWGASTYSTLNIVAGTATTCGRVRANLRANSNISVHPAVGGYATCFGNGSFESAALTDLTLGGSTVPVRDNTKARTGTWSLRFTTAVGATSNASRNIPCVAGQSFVGQLWYQTAGLVGSGGGTFSISLSYLDAGGTVLSSASLASVTTNVGTWTAQPINMLVAAPPGTVNASISIALFGVTLAGPANCYIDDLTGLVV